MSVSLGEKARHMWHVQRVKRLVRDRLGNSAQCLVSVRETICTDPICEGPATEIKIVTLGFQEIKMTIHKGVSDIVDADVSGCR